MTALVLAAFLGAAPADTVRAPACPGTIVLDRETLQGMQLATDVFSRLGASPQWTVDGFDHRPSADNGWVVTIDGVPLDPGPFGSPDLHLLPVQPGEIARVVYCPEPTLVAGRFAAGGVVAITTKAAAGLLLEGSARVANESGDPGPRRYLPGAAPNVDKIGPDIAGVAAGPLWSAGARFERRYPSDPHAFVRNSAALGAFPATRYGAAGVRASLPGGTLRFDGGGSYASDLWMLPAAGRELPVLRLGTHGALTAGRAVGGVVLGGRLAARWTSLERRPEMPDTVFTAFDPNWGEATIAIDAELRHPGATHVTSGGLHVTGFRSYGPGLFDGTGGLVRVWATRGWAAGPWRRRSSVALVSDGGYSGLEAAASVQRIVSGGAVGLTIARDDMVPAENRDVAYWASRGYTGLRRPAVTYTPTLVVGRGTEWSARLDGSWRATGGVVLRASLAGRGYRGLTLHEAAFRPDSGEFVAGEVRAGGGHSGSVIEASAGADGRVGPVNWRLSYRFESVVAGDHVFRDVRGAAPEHVIAGSAAVRPDPSLMMRLGLVGRSGVRWPAYAAFDGASVPGFEEVYEADTPGALLVDLDVEKSILAGRVLLSASARNLLNVTDRTHPLGASLAFRLWVSATLRLSSGRGQPAASSPF